MNEPSREKVKELFAAAVELDGEARTAYLDSECADDPVLRREVESLLSHDGSRGGDAFGDDQLRKMRAAVDDALTPANNTSATLAGPIESEIPTSVGGYAIVRLIGRGGMGDVYEATQEQPKRRVALKVIQSGAMSDLAFKRFEHEVQVLGRLQHPGIAHIYDAGTARVEFAGKPGVEQPFFAMEYVDGRSLTEFARSAKLGIEERLRLVVRVCDAIQHAHQKGVIHRDLKPANIMVDASGQPKILDFGVARSIESDIHTVTLCTDPGQIVGTLGYMSPEQLTGNSAKIDTRSDVYAIGVILYELLSDQLPHDVRGRSLAAALRSIQDDEPTRLGTLQEACRGDLETIVAKALDKDPERRYHTASELSSDIRRYLTDEPIIARPPSSIYQLKKFAKRHRAVVSVVVLLFVVLVAGVVVSTRQAIRARDAEVVARQRLTDVQQAERVANERLNRAENAEQLARDRMTRLESALQEADAVINFLEEMLTQADPAKTMGESLTVRSVLDSASDTIDRYSLGMSVVEARIRRTIGKTYEMMGLYGEAVEPLKEALAIRRQELGEKDRQTLKSMRDLAKLQFHLGRLEEASALLNDLIPRLRANDKEPELLALALETQGSLHKRRSEFPRAIASLEESVTLLEEHVKRDGPIGRVKGELGAALMRVADYERAERLLREAVGHAEREHGAESAYVAGLLSNLGIVLNRSGRPMEAEPMYEEALRIQQKLHGPNHPTSVSTLLNICTLRVDTRRYDEAILLIDDAIAGTEATHGTDSFQMAIAVGTKSSALIGLDRLEEAYQLADQALVIFRKVFGDRHEYIGTQLVNLSNLHVKMNQFAEAEANLLEAKEIYRDTVGAEHPWTGLVIEKLGRVASMQGDHEEARGHLTQALSLYESKRGQGSPEVASCLATWAEAEMRAEEYETAASMWLRVLEIRSKSSRVLPMAESCRRYADCLGRLKPSDDVLGDVSRVLERYGQAHLEKNCLKVLNAILRNSNDNSLFAINKDALAFACSSK